MLARLLSQTSLKKNIAKVRAFLFINYQRKTNPCIGNDRNKDPSRGKEKKKEVTSLKISPILSPNS